MGAVQMTAWIQTYLGKRFTPLAPQADDIEIEDIAHALAHKCRYGGHTKRFYSVAEHSVFVARHASPENRLTALLHDASEAYLADVPRPIKPHLPGYYAIEEMIDRAVARRFGLTYPWPAEVHDLDTRILADEKDKLMGPAPAAWNLPLPPLDINILPCWPPGYAKQQFMAAFDIYTAQTQAA
jgi:hypothetical protein